MKCLGRACWLIFFFSFFKIKILHLNLPVTLSSHVRFPALYALFPLSVSYTKEVSVLAWLRLHLIGFAAVASLTAEWMGVLLCQGSTVPAGRTYLEVTLYRISCVCPGAEGEGRERESLCTQCLEWRDPLVITIFKSHYFFEALLLPC